MPNHNSWRDDNDRNLPHRSFADVERSDRINSVRARRNNEVDLLRMARLLNIGRRWEIFGDGMRMILP